LAIFLRLLILFLNQVMAYEIIGKSVELCQNLAGVLIRGGHKVAGIEDEHTVIIHEVEKLAPRDLDGFSYLRIGGLSAGLALMMAAPDGNFGFKPDPGD
jgi:hypothetical protein